MAGDREADAQYVPAAARKTPTHLSASTPGNQPANTPLHEPDEIVFRHSPHRLRGFEALKLGRRFYGCEIKDEYIAAARNNLKAAVMIEQDSRRTLFDMV